VDQLLRRGAALGVDQVDPRPEQVQLARKVAREGGADAPAQDHHPPAHVGQQRHRLLHVPIGEKLQRALEVVAGDLERVLDRGVAPGLVAVAHQRRAEPGLHLQAEALLELGVAPKAELGDEPRDGRRADARALGEPGHALQADYYAPYRQAGKAVGAEPVDLPPGTPSLPDVDGLLLPGGWDVDPALYGEDPDPNLGPVDRELDDTELRLFSQAHDKGLPVMGICRGQQVINVAMG